MKQPAVYILASKPYGTLYVGVTSNLASRIEAHRSGAVEGFTKTYGVGRLVYFELHETMPDAIQREKHLKKWKRAWKLELIEKANPLWTDLAEQTF
jgi:putative endonuclease